MAAAAFAAPAHAGDGGAQQRVIKVLEDLIEDQNLRADGDSSEESLLATPPLTDLLIGRTELTLDPAFWTQIVANLLVSQTVVIPKPVDLVKVEALLPTSHVATGKRAWPLARRDKPLADLTYEWQGRTKTLSEFVRSTETDGVAFLQRGRIVTDLTPTAGRPTCAISRGRSLSRSSRR